MEKTRIIMTEVTCPQGKYTLFTVKENAKRVAVVDRRDGVYTVYAGWPFFDELGSRTKKDAAIKLAQRKVLEFIPDAEFKWNVMRQIDRYV